MHKVFIDSSTWISYCLSGQPKHSTIKKTVKELIKDSVMICTSNDVIDETVTRLIYDADIKIAEKFINLIKDSSETNNVVQLWVDEEIQEEAFGIVQKFAEHKLSLTDATTIALVKKYSIQSIISLDSDFAKVKAPVLLLES